MAIITTAPVAKAPAVDLVPTVLEYNPCYKADDDEGIPTLSVGYQGKGFKGRVVHKGFRGGLPKWDRVMGLDKDGDAVLTGIFQVLWMHRDEQGRQELVDVVGLFYEQVQKFVEEQGAAEQGQETIEEEAASQVKAAPPPPVVAPKAPEPVVPVSCGNVVKTADGRVFELKWTVEEIYSTNAEWMTWTAEQLAEGFAEKEITPAKPAPSPKVEPKPAPAAKTVAIVKSDRHIGGSEKHYRENVHLAIKSAGLTDSTNDNVVAKRIVEDMVRAAWKAAKYQEYTRMF